MNKAQHSQSEGLLLELQAVDFVLVELNLYLDTHPNDAQALQQFNHYTQIRADLARRYEAVCGPLLNFGHSASGFPWQWINTPWPWQM